jgi:hypothetical protein
MMEFDREQLRKTYQLCRTGFFLLSVALIPACAWSLLLLVVMLGGNRRLFVWLVQLPLNEWIYTLSVWSSVVGTTLLWGRWEIPSWQRRSGLLLVMCLVDLAIWFLDHGQLEGLGEGPWFRSKLGQALGWAEFALIASLAGDYLTHLGVHHAEDSARSTRSLAATGAIVWMLLFCEQTRWGAGWPLQPRNFPTIEGWLLRLGSDLIWAITLLQVTLLAIASIRQTNQVLREMSKEEQEMHFDELLSSTSPVADDAMPLQQAGPDLYPWSSTSG